MNSVRLAIATSDGTSVAAHLARSASFLVIEVEDGRFARTAHAFLATVIGIQAGADQRV